MKDGENKKIVTRQLEKCSQHKSDYVEAPFYMMVAIARGFDKHKYPVNGLRHPPEGPMCGWYLWSGEEFPIEKDAFVTVHVAHIIKDHEELAQFLGLPPGWRFLYAGPYEDVWRDEKLLAIDAVDATDPIFKGFNLWLQKP